MIKPMLERVVGVLCGLALLLAAAHAQAQGAYTSSAAPAIVRALSA